MAIRPASCDFDCYTDVEVATSFGEALFRFRFSRTAAGVGEVRAGQMAPAGDSAAFYLEGKPKPQTIPYPDGRVAQPALIGRHCVT